MARKPDRKAAVKADKRREIMRAAERFSAGRRFHEITLDKVARAAKVSKGTIYLYFKDKDDLFFQIAMSGFDELCEVLAARLPGDAGLCEQLVAAARGVTAFFDARRPLVRMITAASGRMRWLKGGLRERWLEHRTRLLDAVAGIMRKGAADGEIRRDVPALTLASVFLGLLRARAHDRQTAGVKAVSDEALVDLFCAGACSRDAGAPKKGGRRVRGARHRTRRSTA